MVIDSHSKEHDEEDDFFSFESATSVTVNDSEATAFLENMCNNLNTLKLYPVVLNMFKRYNTVIPSSAPVERLFSTGGKIMTPYRLTDETFEQLLILKANSHFKS